MPKKAAPRFFTVFDTETTKLTVHPDANPARQPEITEFGAVHIDTQKRKIIEEVSILVRPKAKITDEITKITGISNELVKDAPDFKTAWPSIKAVFDRSFCFCAHNLIFDLTVLNAEAARIGAVVPWPRTLCTLETYRHQWGWDMKLTDLYRDIVGAELAQEHRALPDVRALAAIVIKEKLWELVA